jgi:hypothetical protein
VDKTGSSTITEEEKEAIVADPRYKVLKREPLIILIRLCFITSKLSQPLWIKQATKKNSPLQLHNDELWHTAVCPLERNDTVADTAGFSR